jgi:hypothetical protein
MDSENRSLGFDKHYESLRKQIFAVLDLLKVKDLTKALGRIEKLYSTIKSLEETIQEICDLTNTTHIGNAKNKINGLLRKSGDMRIAAQKYNLDTSFLKGVGARWERTAPGKNQLQIVENLQKNIDRQRSIVTEYYHKYLDQIVLFCEKEGLSETDTREQVERWHTAMVEDFDLLSATEFFEKYYGDFHNLSVLPKEPASVMLVEALPLVRSVVPERIYQELTDEQSNLGYITQHTFNIWNETVASAMSMRHADALKAISDLKVKIVGTALYRVLKGPESLPNVGAESNTLTMLLADPEVNPYSSEFILTDKTTLFELMKEYAQYAEVKLP